MATPLEEWSTRKLEIALDMVNSRWKRLKEIPVSPAARAHAEEVLSNVYSNISTELKRRKNMEAKAKKEEV